LPLEREPPPELPPPERAGLLYDERDGVLYELPLLRDGVEYVERVLDPFELFPELVLEMVDQSEFDVLLAGFT
jgi:hypothetical protein